MSNGNIIALACGPLKRQRYINTKLEIELLEFKQEIEEKFQKSKLQTFVMPRLVQTQKHKIDIRESQDLSDLSQRQLSMQIKSMTNSNRNHQRQLVQSTDAATIHQYIQQVKAEKFIQPTKINSVKFDKISQVLQKGLTTNIGNQIQILNDQSVNLQVINEKSPKNRLPAHRGNSKLEPVTSLNFVQIVNPKQINLENMIAGISTQESNKNRFAQNNFKISVVNSATPRVSGLKQTIKNISQLQDKNNMNNTRYLQAVEIYSGQTPAHQRGIGNVRLDPISGLENLSSLQLTSLNSSGGENSSQQRSKTNTFRNQNLVATSQQHQLVYQMQLPNQQDLNETERAMKSVKKQPKQGKKQLVLQSYNNQMETKTNGHLSPTII